VQNDGAVEQWLDGPSSSSRNLSDRIYGQENGAEGMYIKPSILIFNMSPALVQCVWLWESAQSRSYSAPMMEILTLLFQLPCNSYSMCASGKLVIMHTPDACALQIMTYQKHRQVWTGGSAGRLAATGDSGGIACGI